MPPAELERFRKVEEIFHAALEKPAGEDRDTLVRERCGGDESLRTEIGGMLANDEHVLSARGGKPRRRKPVDRRDGVAGCVGAVSDDVASLAAAAAGGFAEGQTGEAPAW